MKKSFIRKINMFVSIHRRIYIIPKLKISKNVKTFVIGTYKYVFTLSVLCFSIEIGYLNN